MVKKLTTLFFLICYFIFPVPSVEANVNENNEMTPINGLIKNQSSIFSYEFADMSYDFTKVKKVYILDVDTSLLDISDKIDKAKVYVVNETNVKKPMKCKVVDKGEADVMLEVIVENWRSSFNHTVPKRTAYEVYESYEGYQEPDFFERTRWESAKRAAEKSGRKAPPKPRRKWVVSSTWFYGSKKVITADSRGGKAHKTLSNTPVYGAKQVVLPAYDVFSSNVVAVINLREPNTNKVLLTRKGTYNSQSRIEDNQISTYKELFSTFCREYKALSKQIKKKHKESKAS